VGKWSRNSHHPFGHPPQRLVFGIEGLECHTPVVVSPLELAGHRPLQAVDLCYQSGVPGDLPQPGASGVTSKILAGIGSRRSSHGQLLGIDAARAFRTAPEKFSTQVSVAISLCNCGLNGIRSSKLVSKLAQSVLLKSGRSGGC
jgi:hypothetical protein